MAVVHHRGKRRVSLKQRAHAAPPITDAKEKARPTRVSAFAYGPEGVDEHEQVDPDSLPGLVGKRPVTWIDVDGYRDTDVIERVARALDLHPLAVEDATNPFQRPKYEEYPTHAFVV